MLGTFRAVFTAPGFAIFTDLLAGWVCAPGRRTVTGMIAVADPDGRRAHDAYHRFLRDGAWKMSRLWHILCGYAVGRLAPGGVVELVCDDTLHHKTGPKVAGSGIFRDAVRSTVKKVVYARGLNLVVICLRVTPPWGGCPIAIPVNARLHRKNDQTTTIGHAANMMREIAGWLPGRPLHLTADGAYATLAGRLPAGAQLTCRMRRDAALYQPAPPRTGRRGRPRTKGDRLPTPPQLAAQASGRDWQQVQVDQRGTPVTRLVLVRDVLWYTVQKHRLLRLVIVRDPDGIENDDFFFTTDLTATGAETATRYAGRWPIEVTYRDVKTRPRRAGPAVLETPRTRTRSRPVAVAARRHLVLVPTRPPGRPHLDGPALVPAQDHPQLPRRPRRAPQSPMGTTNYSHVIPQPGRHENHRGPTRHARLRGLTRRQDCESPHGGSRDSPVRPCPHL